MYHVFNRNNIYTVSIYKIYLFIYYDTLNINPKLKNKNHSIEGQLLRKSAKLILKGLNNNFKKFQNYGDRWSLETKFATVTWFTD